MVLERFHAIAQGLYGWVVDESEIESHTLAALRDTLLPKLIFGELHLAGHEQFLEAMQ